MQTEGVRGESKKSKIWQTSYVHGPKEERCDDRERGLKRGSRARSRSSLSLGAAFIAEGEKALHVWPFLLQWRERKGKVQDCK